MECQDVKLTKNYKVDENETDTNCDDGVYSTIKNEII